MSTNPLISLWEVLCEGSFYVLSDMLMWEWRKAQAWGCSHGIPLEYLRIFKRITLGMPKASPPLRRLSWGRLRWTKFLSLYILCAILGASFYFSFSFALFCLFAGHPLFFIDYHEVVFVELSFYHFTYYVLFLECYFILLLFSFCLFAGHIHVGSYPSCVGERHAPLFHLNTPVLRLYLVEYS